MTSFAFIFGVLPLALSTGAGARSRVEIGTTVLGGMIAATVLAIFYVPLSSCCCGGFSGAGCARKSRG